MARLRALALAVALAAAALAAAPEARAASAEEIDARVDIALNRLLAESVPAQALAERALAVLVFPQIVKGGSGSAASTARGRSGRTAPPSATIRSPRPPSGCRSGRRPMPRRSSS